MRSQTIVYRTFLILSLALIWPASRAHAGGVVSVCDEVHLLAALAGGGTVTFSCSGTITLTSTITIAADTTVDGSGQAITISGDHTMRVFTVNSGATLNLNRLTVAHGSAGEGSGGGIYNDRGSTVTVSNGTFSSNTAGQSGGGIYNYGTMTVTSSVFSGNEAREGGGIDNDGYYGGTLTVSNTSFSSNHSSHNGGGILNEGGVLFVSSSTFFDNSADNAGGGIINGWGGGMLSVRNSAFSGNRASAGGGIANSDAMLTVSDSTFTDNSASAGGGINNNGALTVSNSTFYDNDAGIGGGIYNGYNTAEVSNSTFSGNRASNVGGGIVNGYGTVEVSNSTFSGNRASGNAGAIYGNVLPAIVTLRNTIVADSPAGGNCFGAIIDGGGNLSYPDTTCPGINGDPLLDPLQGNGGPTKTHALLPGSPALNAGNPAGCTDHLGNPLETDQRGFPRFGRCDIGAYELQPLGFSTKTADSPVAQKLDPVTYTIALTNGGPTAIPSVRVTDTLPISLTYTLGSLSATGGSAGFSSGVITWTGSVDAGKAVTVTFGATTGTELGQIANSAVIAGAGEIYTRTASVQVMVSIYLPIILK